MVRRYVAVTDQAWFDMLSATAPHDESNFWQPSGNRQFRAVGPGELFPFTLHAPQNFISGGGGEHDSVARGGDRPGDRRAAGRVVGGQRDDRERTRRGHGGQDEAAAME